MENNFNPSNETTPHSPTDPAMEAIPSLTQGSTDNNEPVSLAPATKFGKNFLVTPALILVNLGIFIAMVISGANVFNPDAETLIQWGALFRTDVLAGEWWRLFTAAFLHIGILHLAMNMYALFDIGKTIEPMVGPLKFILIYLLCALGGSTASLYWNSFSVGAGASGAIFGLFGFYLALLTTDLIDSGTRKKELTTLAVFMGYNLLYGLKGGVDNAAHIGGLVSGFIIGKSFYYVLSEPGNKALERNVLLALIIGFVLTTTLTISTVTDPLTTYETKYKRFTQLEKSALETYQYLGDTSIEKEKMLYEINDRGLYYWNEAKDVLKEIDQLELPQSLKERNKLMHQYVDTRISTYELFHKAVWEDSRQYDQKILEATMKTDSILNLLNVNAIN
ncbi:rhomboid family intramembrane serine protease [Flavihumibacter rivuli]|uniref:rhomboid family intramembrane serine protease n=1 Tax=Flavihumibacter rivuli TaxID=2838156 RepID=UPI001BDDCDD3|nr:rhomboid family intramembrane serine protease [Flavihumibacter rivuli]ULQ57387.1 rhomboid family intramembrane serine protease [Flavihumibacter rivuli]